MNSDRSKQRDRDKKHKSRSSKDERQLTNKDDRRGHKKENGTYSEKDAAKKDSKDDRKVSKHSQQKEKSSDDRRKEKSSDDRRKEKSSDDRRKEKSSDDRRKEKSSDDRRKEKSSDDRRKEKSSDDRRKEKSSDHRRKEKSSDDRQKEKSSDDRRKERSSDRKYRDKTGENIHSKRNSPEEITQKTSKERNRDYDRKHKSRSEHSSRKSEKEIDTIIEANQDINVPKSHNAATTNVISNEPVKDYPDPENDKKKMIIEREKSMLETIQKNAEQDDNDYNYDDEEFDDYDDDFESEVDDSSNNSDMSFGNEDSDYDSADENKVANAISDSHRNQIKEAMALENSRISSSTPPAMPSSPANTPIPSDDNKESQKLRKSTRGLDFVAAQKIQESSKAMSKSAKRGKDLLRLVELDTVSFDLFELNPQTEYEIYMKSFGRSDTHQMYTQYNEDCLEKEVMTEPSDVKTCWTQHPIEGSTAFAYEGESVDEEENKSGAYNPLTLNKFVSISAHIMVTLLEERASRHGYTTTFKPVSTSKISDTAALFPTTPICSTRAPIFAAPISPQSFAVSYTKPKGNSGVEFSGMTCCWDLQTTTQPTEVLVSNAAHRCACVSPYNQNFVFVGCEDGSVILWDLNEPGNLHITKYLNDKRYVLRLPTYNTCGINVAESHNSKITNLQPIKFEQEHDKSQMSSFQIASLDENGAIIIWVAVTVTDPSMSGSQTDLGLRPGGKVKLVKSALINVNFPHDKVDLFPELRTFAFRQHFSDASTYYVTTDKGAIIKASRNHHLPQPTYYNETFSVPSIVGSIDFNKFNWKYFLSGSSDGTVCLYYLNQPHPIVTWDRTTRGRPIRVVQWSQYSSTIFYVMDSANKLYMWDLSVRDSTPVAIETYDDKGLLFFTEMPKSAGSNSPIILFCFKDGTLEAHHIREEAMNNNVNNITKLEQYLSSVS